MFEKGFHDVDSQESVRASDEDFSSGSDGRHSTEKVEGGVRKEQVVPVRMSDFI